MGILIGAQICACLILPNLKPRALNSTKEVLFLVRRIHSLLLELHSSRHIRPLHSTWRPFPASLNDIPADPSKPLTAASIWVCLFHLLIYQTG